MTRLILLAVLGVVIAFTAAAAEAALQRMSRVRAEELLDQSRPGARALVRVVGDSAPYLSVLSFVRVTAEMTTAVLVALAVSHAVEGTLRPFLIAVGVLVVVSFVIVVSPARAP